MDLDGLDAMRVEEACFEFGALAVSYTDQRDDPILEPAPGEFRLWPHSRLQALFPFDCKPQEIVAGLSRAARRPGRHRRRDSGRQGVGAGVAARLPPHVLRAAAVG